MSFRILITKMTRSSNKSKRHVRNGQKEHARPAFMSRYIERTWRVARIVRSSCLHSKHTKSQLTSIVVHPRLGDNISIITCEDPHPELADGFWKWMHETYLPYLLEGPTVLRARIFKEVGESRQESTIPSAPYVSHSLWVQRVEYVSSCLRIILEETGISPITFHSVPQADNTTPLVDLDVWMGRRRAAMDGVSECRAIKRVDEVLRERTGLARNVLPCKEIHREVWAYA